MVLCIESCGNPWIQGLEWKAPSVFKVGLRARLGFALAYIGSKIDYRVPEKVVSAGVFLAMEKKKGSLYREPNQQLLLNKHYYNG